MAAFSHGSSPRGLPSRAICGWNDLKKCSRIAILVFFGIKAMAKQKKRDGEEFDGAAMFATAN